MADSPQLSVKDSSLMSQGSTVPESLGMEVDSSLGLQAPLADSLSPKASQDRVVSQSVPKPSPTTLSVKHVSYLLLVFVLPVFTLTVVLQWLGC